ncbi:MAG: methyl-accepting chemotaxis protein, partial [Cytophagales bacterium]|nr:methyl-accepting chemotaxis protein [Cytophagales bacterium]
MLTRLVGKSEVIVEGMLLDVKQVIAGSTQSVQFFATIISLFSAVSVLILILLTNRSIIRPLKVSCEKINAIRSENNLSSRLKPTGNDEVSLLCMNFDSLLDDFEQLFLDVNNALSVMETANQELIETIAASNEGVRLQIKESDVVTYSAQRTQRMIEAISRDSEAAALR